MSEVMTNLQAELDRIKHLPDGDVSSIVRVLFANCCPFWVICKLKEHQTHKKKTNTPNTVRTMRAQCLRMVLLQKKDLCFHVRPFHEDLGVTEELVRTPRIFVENILYFWSKQGLWLSLASIFDGHGEKSQKLAAGFYDPILPMMIKDEAPEAILADANSLVASSLPQQPPSTDLQEWFDQEFPLPDLVETDKGNESVPPSQPFLTQVEKHAEEKNVEPETVTPDKPFPSDLDALMTPMEEPFPSLEQFLNNVSSFPSPIFGDNERNDPLL